MAVNVPNPGIYLAQIGQHLVNLREAINDLVQDGTYLNAMGGAAFLEAAPFNMAATDAQLYISTIGAVTATNSVVESINSFLTSAVALTGGN
jgi:hypothetical protein